MAVVDSWFGVESELWLDVVGGGVGTKGFLLLLKQNFHLAAKRQECDGWVCPGTRVSFSRVDINRV